MVDKKPIIYLYPNQKQNIKIKLNYKGEIIADYPEYDDEIKGWEVEAYPDGKVIDLRD
jgi:GH25 family lysozyme M1 (1,4-beta-N-acetylmuramidase)